jgi:Glycosyl transferase family 2
MCPTFGRPTFLLEETLYSFLGQDYPGSKQLVLLNDFKEAYFEFGDPEVTIVNVPQRFHTLGEKRNALAAMCRYDYLAVWDDDDIYLPHRLKYSIQMLDPERRFFKPSAAFLLNGHALRGPVRNLFHGGALWHRSLFNEVGGYQNLNSGEDMRLESDFQKVIGPNKNYDAIEPTGIFYLYRWQGTESYHLSAFGEDSEVPTSMDKVSAYVAEQLRQGLIATGVVRLEPRWRIDYVALTEAYISGVPVFAAQR